MLHIEYLVEDRSTEIFVNTIMERIIAEHHLGDVTYRCTGFHGRGNIPKRDSVNEVKNGLILHDLPQYLRGFSHGLRNLTSVIIVILDNDRDDQFSFRKQVQALIDENLGTLDNVLCIAVEELEAWLLGDEMAIIQAYPNAKMSVIRNYKQDSICGTWETLADAVYPGGLRRLEKDAQQYRTLGSVKCKWAREIGAKLSFSDNHSPSFNYFKKELFKRMGVGV